MTEAQIQAEILLRCGSIRGVRLFRNLVGEGWVGRIADRGRNHVTLVNPRHVSFGWCPGSSDLLGWRARIVTPDLIGTQIAQLAALEIKGPRTQVEPSQQNWHRALISAGALSGIVRSTDEAQAALGLVTA